MTQGNFLDFLIFLLYLSNVNKLITLFFLNVIPESEGIETLCSYLFFCQRIFSFNVNRSPLSFSRNVRIPEGYIMRHNIIMEKTRLLVFFLLCSHFLFLQCCRVSHPVLIAFFFWWSIFVAYHWSTVLFLLNPLFKSVSIIFFQITEL